jgi:transposase InsO family protein
VAPARPGNDAEAPRGARGQRGTGRRCADRGASRVNDTYAKVGFAKLDTDKTPVTAADLLNDRVLPFFAEHGIPVSRLLTDRGTEYCGTPDRHPFELYLALEGIEHTRTKTKHPQTNGICERFNKTLLDEFYRVAFRRTCYEDLASRQADLDTFVDDDNQRRPHQGRWCYGKTPMQTLLDSLALAKETLIASPRASTPALPSPAGAPSARSARLSDHVLAFTLKP